VVDLRNKSTTSTQLSPCTSLAKTLANGELSILWSQATQSARGATA
jgi:hypothetical protein